MPTPPEGPPPDVSEELIEHLERLFPLRPPAIKSSYRYIWRDVGRQDIIQVLRNLRSKVAEARRRGSSS
jgi:hypothetical protein